jgi:hypothetical protein
MLNQLLGWTVYLGVVSGIVYTGWNEPLHYRFMTSQELAAAKGVQLQDAQQSQAPPNMQSLPAPAAATWRPMGTVLERAPYEKKGGQIIYSNNYDHYTTGTGTENPEVKNRTHLGPASP